LVYYGDVWARSNRLTRPSLHAIEVSDGTTCGALGTNISHIWVPEGAEPSFDERRFRKCDWKAFYPEAAEAIPPKMPKPRGGCISMTCFVDADHVGYRITRRSHTGVLLYDNRAPIIWYSKHHDTVETSTFESEFVAMKTAIELVEGIKYKLRMMFVPVEGPTSVFCGNSAVVINTSAPESTLEKKHNDSAYHRAREASDAGTIRIAKEDGYRNQPRWCTYQVNGGTTAEAVVVPHLMVNWTGWSEIQKGSHPQVYICNTVDIAAATQSGATV
jgi:hypothetical protein